MGCFNLFANAEITSPLFPGIFGSVFATFWTLLDLMWACEKTESSFTFVTRFLAVAVAILSLTGCWYFLFFSRWTRNLSSLAIGLALFFSYSFFFARHTFPDILLYVFRGIFCIVLQLAWGPLSSPKICQLIKLNWCSSSFFAYIFGSLKQLNKQTTGNKWM